MNKIIRGTLNISTTKSYARNGKSVATIKNMKPYKFI